MINLYFGSNSPCITYLFLYFTGEKKNVKFPNGDGRLRDTFARRVRDQIMGRFRVISLLIKFFKFNSSAR